MNANHEEVSFTLPSVASGMTWVSLIDTARECACSPDIAYEAMTQYPLQPRSLALLVERQRDQIRQDRRNGA
jgi:hypothetical protein